MEDKNKLFRVTLKGMTTNFTGVKLGISYVIAKNSDEAYRKVRTFLDEKNFGFKKDRELDKVELIAEDYQYTDTGHMLFL